MIIGFVIILVIALVFSLRQAGIGVKPADYLSSKIEDVNKQIKECNKEKLIEVLDILGRQGGSLEPSSYRRHNGYKVNYLCSNIPLRPECLNNMLFVEDIENEIEEYLDFNVPICTNLDRISQQLFFPEIKSAKFVSDVEIRQDSIFVKINYPVSLVKGNEEVTLKDFSQSVSVPLGNLLDVTYDVVNEEAKSGIFLNLPYMIANRGEVEIFVDQKEYPDKIYVLNERNSDYVFQFAVQGERG